MKKKNKTRKTNIDYLKKQIKEIDTELKEGVFIYTGPMTVVEFATKINKKPIDLVKEFFIKGKNIGMNSTLNDEQIAELCIEFGYDFQREKEVTASNILDELKIDEDKENLIAKPPVVTIMGHVDHGKTTLIDYIRKSKITKSEYGGITQHMGAYYVDVNNKQKITFLDTPGHETFTAMRSRGAKITDIVVIVVAADDGVKEQTKEAIDHALAANVPIIIFVNKMDKQNVDLEKLKSEISNTGLTLEEWGGDTPIIYGSALTGKGVDDLLNNIVLLAEVQGLKENPDRLPIGTIIESRVDKGQGVISTIIIQKGTLKPRDFIVAGTEFGRVRTIKSTNDNSPISEVTPGMPAIITGLKTSVSAGAKFMGFVDEKFAKNFANKKKFEDKQRELKYQNLFNASDGIKVHNIIVKSDVAGTAEAIKYALNKVENDEVKIKVIRAAVGEVTKSDVALAKTSNATIYAFNLSTNSTIKKIAQNERIKMFSSNIIYEIIEDAENTIKGLKAPKYELQQIGEAQILKVIFASNIGNIAGCKLESGKITANCGVELYRGDKLIHTGKIDSLKRGLNDAKLVDAGKEFGCHIEKFDNIKEGDIIKTFENVLVNN